MTEHASRSHESPDPAHEASNHPASQESGSIEDELAIASTSYLWYAKAAERELNALLVEVKAADEPTWNERLAGELLEAAIDLGAIASGHFLASKLGGFAMKFASSAAKAAGEHPEALTEAAHEFFKVGIQAGYKAGHQAMHAGSHSASPERFVNGQMTAVDALAMEGQNHFIRKTRHQVRSVAEAKEFSNACSKEHMEQAARLQRVASRDAWVRYLAQSKYGSFRRGKDAPVTTNMTDAATRKRVNAGGPGVVPEHAPSMLETAMYKAPGVLSVKADVPMFDKNGHAVGQPRVSLAYLGGVNDSIREAYQGEFLDDVHIPIHLDAQPGVGGFGLGQSHFTVNVDETGQCMAASGAAEHWLEANQRSANPESKLTGGRAVQAGLKILLSELVVREIRRPK
jgi:hypothetical protein